MTLATTISIAALGVLTAAAGCGRKGDPVPPAQARGQASHGLSNSAAFHINSRHVAVRPLTKRRGGTNG